MKLFKVAALAAAALAVSFSINTGALAHDGEHDEGPFSTPEPAVTEIKAVLTGYAAEVAKSNIEGMAGYVIQSDDFSIIEGSHANWGWADYRANHLGPEFESDKFKITDYSYSDIRVSVSGEVAYATYNSRIEYIYDGVAKAKDGMGTVVLVKTKEGWRIRHMQS